MHAHRHPVPAGLLAAAGLDPFGQQGGRAANRGRRHRREQDGRAAGGAGPPLTIPSGPNNSPGVLRPPRNRRKQHMALHALKHNANAETSPSMDDEDRLDQTIEDSFPASDPPSSTP